VKAFDGGGTAKPGKELHLLVCFVLRFDFSNGWFACLFFVWATGCINRALAFLYVHLISASGHYFGVDVELDYSRMSVYSRLTHPYMTTLSLVHIMLLYS
jgi:hypothetical protein